MKTMSMTDFKQLTKQQLDEAEAAYLPATITFDSEPYLIVARIGEIIPLSDLHPRVRTQLRALEAKARVGMSAPERLWLDSPTPTMPEETDV